MGPRPAPLRPLRWVASSRKDLKRFPEEVQDVMGRALLDVQFGDRPPNSKPMKGFSGAYVSEITDDFRGDTYRVVYTAAFPEVVYVLHAFKKKSKRGARTPKPEIDLIHDRYRVAEQHFQKQQ